jgi:hypothetical protein
VVGVRRAVNPYRPKICMPSRIVNGPFLTANVISGRVGMEAAWPELVITFFAPQALITFIVYSVHGDVCHLLPFM